MASSDATQRAVLAGLSCGIGLAAPVVMYAATLPFSSVNETVVAGAVPFAVGAVAGVGIYAASLGISEYRAQREERLFQPDAMGGAANLNQHQSEFKTASIPAQQQDATPYAAASASQAQAEQSTSAFLSGLTGAFQHRHADDGVPTIARAADAMDEAEAWSMIDSMLDDDSPVSCDPAHSRDVYQVAIDELTLSFSELEAIIHIFDELDGDEGILVASKIADRVGITRSVIVNALRKFESAGVIESRSSGMKGTYIKVLNEVIFDELEEIKTQRNKKA